LGVEMADIGPTLREARLRDGRDITEIEEQTKIRSKYLRALENEEWALLPGPTFTRAFLRTYAGVLGLDAKALVEQYRRQWEQPHELDVVPVRPVLGTGPRDSERPRKRHGSRRLIGVALLIVLLAVAVLLIGRGPGKTSGNHQHVTTPPATVPARTTATVATSCDSTPLPRNCVSLQVDATTPVYVCLIGDDGNVRIRGVDLDSRSRRITYHARQFILTLGNSSAALRIDGHAYAIEAAVGAVRYEITQHLRKKLATPTRLTCK
jgi:hypothetical protein